MNSPKGERVGTMNYYLPVKQKQQTGREEAGDVITSSVLIANIYCALDYRMRGSEEFMLMGQIHPQTTVLCYTWKRDDFDTTMFVEIDGKEYRIDSILPHEDKLLMTMELVSNDYGD